MARFTVVQEDAFDALQLNAGVLLSKFDPANPVKPDDEDIIATTTGGINPTCTANYSDYGEDVDNVPNNMMEFKQLDGWDCGMSFSTIRFNAENTVWALGAADKTTGDGYTKVVPRADVKLTDYKDVWWVGDKANGGAFAVKLKNALSTGGLSIQTTKNGKGTNAVTLTGHVSINDQETMPMEFYDIDPFEEPTPTPTPSPTTYTVTFDSDGGDAIDPQTIEEGGKVTKPTDPEKTGYTFGGWFKDETTLTDEWDFDEDTVTEDTTLHAKWS